MLMNRAEYLISMFSLEGQVAIVTGGTGALGSAMAKALAMAGARVGVLSRGRERSERVLSELREFGGEALALTADVLDRDSLVYARDTVVARGGVWYTTCNTSGCEHAAATPPEHGVIS